VPIALAGQSDQVRKLVTIAVPAEAVSALLQSAPGAVAEIQAQVARLRHVTPTAELLATLQRGFDAAKDSAEPQEGRAAMREKRRTTDFNFSAKRTTATSEISD